MIFQTVCLTQNSNNASSSRASSDHIKRVEKTFKVAFFSIKKS